MYRVTGQESNNPVANSVIDTLTNLLGGTETLIVPIITGYSSTKAERLIDFLSAQTMLFLKRLKVFRPVSADKLPTSIRPHQDPAKD